MNPTGVSRRIERPVPASGTRAARARTVYGRSESRCRLLLVVVAVCALAACGDGNDPGQVDRGRSSNPSDRQSEPEGDRQTAFRVRGDAGAGLNSDGGWAGVVNEPATVPADRPFRLRLEAAAAGDDRQPRRYHLEFRRNGGRWAPVPAENFPQPEKVDRLDLRAAANGVSGRGWTFAAGNASLMHWIDDDEAGHLRIDTAGSPLLAIGRPRGHWRPREIAFELRLGNDSQARPGLVFGFEDGDNLHRVDVAASGVIRVLRVDDGRETVLAGREADVASGRWLELKAIVDGSELTVEFDDEAVVFTQDLGREDFELWPGLYLPDDSAVDIRTVAVEGEPRSPSTSIVASAAFDHGEPTQDLLAVSDRPFTGGAGVSFAEATPAWQPDDGHGEWEFPLVIRRFSDTAEVNESGDRFDYRLVDAAGEAVSAEATASVTLDVPDGHLGGTFVETPMRIGPWQADGGALYFLMEPAETRNVLMTVKSVDGGDSWREVDGEHRPETGDLEGFASLLVDDRIHMLHQTSDAVWYHVFRTADHPEAPDSWEIRDERVAAPEEPPTQVADIAVRSDGSVVAVYGGPEKIHYRIRSPRGQWGDERIVDADTPARLSGPTVVRGRDDTVHLAYTGSDGSAWYRRIDGDGQLSGRVRITTDLGVESGDVGSILPLLYLPDSDSVAIIYRTRDGLLHERRVDAGGALSEPVAVTDRRVVQNAVDSDQVGADAVVHGKAIHVLFIDAETGHLLHVAQREGRWGEAEVLVADDNVQWVRGAVVELPDGGKAYGYVYDAGSHGGSGMNRYGFRRLPAN